MTSDNEEPTQVIPEEGTPEGQPEEVEAPPKWEPDEHYKGLQRDLEKEKRERRELEDRLDTLTRQQPQQTSGDPLVMQAQLAANQAYAQYLQQGIDQAQATQMASLVGQSTLNTYQLQQMQANEAQRQQQAAIERATEDVTQEMRELARSQGIDPDDPELDYGDRRTVDTAQRLRSFRQSLRVAQAQQQAAAPATPQRAPDRSGAKVDRQEPTGTPGKPDAEAKKRAFEALTADIKQGRVAGNKANYARLAQLKEEAVAAGAVFE